MMYKRILIPYDGSEVSNHALKEALALAKDPDARLRIIHVVDVNPPGIDPAFIDLQAYDQKARAEGEAVLDQAKQRTGQSGIKAEFALISGGLPPGDQIIEEARRWPADLIVMGTHGRSNLLQLLMGNVAEGVVRKTSVPVLLVRGQ